uniref:Family with sequence similarity 174 member B n=1 Tax=Colobus angolensis palliatus TaxID=336983 RepID=A0A2K5I3T9_COLAP
MKRMMRMRTPQYLTSNTGKTCFPVCWHPVESWSAATWGVKTWKPSRVRGVETKTNVMYKTPAPSWVSGVCSECHWQARFHITTTELLLPPFGHPFKVSPTSTPRVRGFVPCYGAKGRNMLILKKCF